MYYNLASWQYLTVTEHGSIFPDTITVEIESPYPLTIGELWDKAVEEKHSLKNAFQSTLSQYCLWDDSGLLSDNQDYGDNENDIDSMLADNTANLIVGFVIGTISASGGIAVLNLILRFFG